MKARALIILLGLAVRGMAQQPLHQPDLAKQRSAMQRLNFLIGNWSGEAHVQRGPGDATTLMQTETAEYKLDGLVLVIEGTGRAQTEQQPSLQALGVISYEMRPALITCAPGMMGGSWKVMFSRSRMARVYAGGSASETYEAARFCRSTRTASGRRRQNSL